jgi:hypothetical protein
MRIWKCPNDCGLSRRAPEKLARDDSRGFCFPCSTSTGRLVRLIAPSVEQAKAARAEARKARRALQRQREAAREAYRLATWPGLLDARWKRWEKHGAAAISPAARASVNRQNTIPLRYAQLVRQALPSAGSPAGRVDREKFLRRLRVPASLRHNLLSADKDAWFVDLWKWAIARAYEWLGEDTGITDAETRATIERVAAMTNPGSIDDVAALNNIISAALAQRGASTETP